MPLHRLLPRESTRMNPAANTTIDSTTAGVVARPPILFLAALLAGFAADRLVPIAFPAAVPALLAWVAGGALVAGGLALAASGIGNFTRAGTPVPTTEPTRALVTTGIHRLSRNPIYVGLFLIYGGIGIAARIPWILILAVPLAIVMRHGVVAREEAYLERRFGDAYRDYRARTRRWL